MLVPFDEEGDPFAAVDPHAAATAAVRRGCVCTFAPLASF
jgi:hypothetical protein